MGDAQQRDHLDRIAKKHSGPSTSKKEIEDQFAAMMHASVSVETQKMAVNDQFPCKDLTRAIPKWMSTSFTYGCNWRWISTRSPGGKNYLQFSHSNTGKWPTPYMVDIFHLAMCIDHIFNKAEEMWVH